MCSVIVRRMDWERTHRRLKVAERLVVEAEGHFARARLAIQGNRHCSTSLTLNAEQTLRSLETMLAHDVQMRDRLKEQLRLLTH